jgi:hypothetical protein
MIATIFVLVGAALVWVIRLGDPSGPVWPSVLATVGFLALGALLVALRRR